MPSLNIRRNDTVKVLRGSDRGKTGRVLRVFPDKGTVLVEHVRVVKKTVSSKQGQRTKGGIAEQESPIDVSNLQSLSVPTAGRRAWASKLEAGHEGTHL
jgi:large subunit ribosomal protein L24